MLIIADVYNGILEEVVEVDNPEKLKLELDQLLKDHNCRNLQEARDNGHDITVWEKKVLLYKKIKEDI